MRTPDRLDRTIAIILIVLGVFLLLMGVALAEQHEHGKDGIPTWYDANCCDRQDCRPVTDDTIDFGEVGGKPVAIYKPEGLLFEKGRWRRSQDERYHVCYRGTSVYCIYIPTSA